uniref:Uncharacterized protein n=1 Tax=Triticum urartu TaxID=4572 RepID=A0A8R7K2C7_TRIUA
MLLPASARGISFPFLLVLVSSLVSGSTRLRLTLMVFLSIRKTCLVGHGFQQEHGPDYHETFAPAKPYACGLCSPLVRV